MCKVGELVTRRHLNPGGVVIWRKFKILQVIGDNQYRVECLEGSHERFEQHSVLEAPKLVRVLGDGVGEVGKLTDVGPDQWSFLAESQQ